MAHAVGSITQFTDGQTPAKPPRHSGSRPDYDVRFARHPAGVGVLRPPRTGHITGRNTVLDLSDPFATEAAWRALAEES